jgi:hypothetical protein
MGDLGLDRAKGHVASSITTRNPLHVPIVPPDGPGQTWFICKGPPRAEGRVSVLCW